MLVLVSSSRPQHPGSCQHEADRLRSRWLVGFATVLLGECALNHLCRAVAAAEYGLPACDLRHDLVVGQVDQRPAGVEHDIGLRRMPDSPVKLIGKIAKDR